MVESTLLEGLKVEGTVRVGRFELGIRDCRG